MVLLVPTLPHLPPSDTSSCKILLSCVSERMSSSCCLQVPTVECNLQTILARIEPIQYVNDTLVVDSPLSVKDTITIGDETLTIVNNVLELPQDTTIAGTPLNALPFTGNILELPPQTAIDGFNLFTTSYVYFFNSGNTTTSNNYIINARYIGSITNTIKFPFVAPENCVLTSLIFSFAVSSSAPSTITNATAYIDVVDLVGTITYTGISVTIPTCPKSSKYFADTKFQYSLAKGHGVGIRFTYSGSAGSVCQFATLGYKFL